MTEAEFFAGRTEAQAIFRRLRPLVESLGETSSRISRSQIAFRRRSTFAAVWTPDRYLKGETAPLVLTLYYRTRHPSRRWKEVVEAAPGRFTHHLELHSADEIDEEVGTLLRSAWAAAA